MTLGAKGGFWRGNEGVIPGQMSVTFRVGFGQEKEGVSNPPTSVTLGGEMRVLYLANSPTSVTFSLAKKKKVGEIGCSEGERGCFQPTDVGDFGDVFFFFKGDETKILLTLQTIC